MTNTLVCLGMTGDKATFRRAFSAATVHDFFSLIAVAILLALELPFGVLEKVSGALGGGTSGTSGGINASIFTGLGAVVDAVAPPLSSLVETAVEITGLGEVLQGIILVLVGVALILLVINAMGKLMQSLMVGRAKELVHTAIGRGPATGVLSGLIITIMVQSKSTTTSLAVPPAGSETFTLRQIYLFTVGTNIYTTTVLIVSFEFSGIEGTLAM